MPRMLLAILLCLTVSLVFRETEVTAQTASPSVSAQDSSPQLGSQKTDPEKIVRKDGQQSSSDQSAQSTGTKANEEGKESAQGKKWHVRLGGVAVSAAYIHSPGYFFDPFYAYRFYPYGFYPFGGYDPFLYDSFYDGPRVYGPGVAYSPDKGKVELSLARNRKDAEVYIDEAYAGPARRLKDIWLQPGAYDLMVAAPDGSSFERRIYVLSGKTVKIRATLVPQHVPQANPEEKQP